MSDNIGISLVTSINLKSRYTACKETWVNDFDNIYLFGGNVPDENLIPLSEAGEDYNSHFLKQQLGLKYIYEDNPNYDWYCVSNCDNVLFKNKIMEELAKYDSKSDILLGQPCGTWTDEPFIHENRNANNTFTALAGGACFFISNSLMKKCYDVIDDFNQLWTQNAGSCYPFSDVAISYMIHKYFNIEPTHSSYMFSQNPLHYESESHLYDYDVRLLIKTPMTFHYIGPVEMSDIYEKYKS
jgi:hypothetical protein